MNNRSASNTARSAVRAAALAWPVLLTLLAGSTVGSTAAAEDEDIESRFLERVRQLTFEGRRAGEGYFSPDGDLLVFQSEREPGNPFYQIYELSFETGEVSRISPGSGKTTCPFYHPETLEILYASTHHDPRSAELQQAELDFRASGQERRYAWDYDPEMDVYVAPRDGGPARRLTRARGYDAEGSYSPDGEWIVFTSNRPAYDGRLDEEQASRLEVDPSWFAEIYVMRADGTEQRRLTETPGYDGGPFFTADGTRIVWRRFDEDGLVADIWTMKPDGTDQRQITDFASMSWAPYPHPSGKYFVFTSNKHGFANFELFVVDVEGKREPVRITYTDRFDGLPVPSPDGGMLAWTSQRHGADKGAQIFLARWNHDAVLEALAAAPARDTGMEADAP